MAVIFEPEEESRIIGVFVPFQEIGRKGLSLLTKSREDRSEIYRAMLAIGRDTYRIYADDAEVRDFNVEGCSCLKPAEAEKFHPMIFLQEEPLMLDEVILLSALRRHESDTGPFFSESMWQKVVTEIGSFTTKEDLLSGDKSALGWIATMSSPKKHPEFPSESVTRLGFEKAEDALRAINHITLAAESIPFADAATSVQLERGGENKKWYVVEAYIDPSKMLFRLYDTVDGLDEETAIPLVSKELAKAIWQRETAGPDNQGRDTGPSLR